MDISVALGGGGIKGIAHIGVLDCLEKAGYHIRAIAGTSVGGLIGAAYASGYRPQELLEIISSLNKGKLYTRQPGDGPSLLGYTGLAQALTEILGNSEFTDLKIPFACTAVDLRTSQEVYLNQGLVMEAVLATIAVPGIFPSMRRGDSELIDGGVLDPVPVNLARCMAPALPVVAVALNPERSDWHRLPQFNILPPASLPIPPPLVDGISRLRIAQAFRTFLHSMDITARMLTEMRLEVDQPEVIVRPDVHAYGILDNVEPNVLIDAGFAAAEAVLPDLRKAVSWPRSVMRILRQPARRRHAVRSQSDVPPSSPTPLPGAPS